MMQSHGCSAWVSPPLPLVWIRLLRLTTWLCCRLRRLSLDLAQQYCCSAPPGLTLQPVNRRSPHFCPWSLQALEPANLGPGKRVLVHAGAGGVGSMAIQLSKLRGAYVVTTCSSKSFPHVKVRGHSPLVRHSRPL